MTIAFFLEMTWKSALIAGAALMLVSLLRSRSAPERSAVLRIGVAMLLLLPLIALQLPALQVEAWTAEALPSSYLPPAELLTYTAAETPSSPASIWDDPSTLFAILYLGGFAMACVHLLGGLWTLGRWTASAAPVEAREWLAALERVRSAMPSRRPVRLLVCDKLRSPLSWGWARPVIMVDYDTLAMTEDADAILAHEWAHVVRQDWPVLMLARSASALFWFNPLVWVLEREIVQQAEEAADGFAARSMDRTRYAQTLVKWAQFGTHGLPANSMAPAAEALARRVRAVLGGGPQQARSAATIGAMAACAIFAGALAALELIPAEANAEPAAAPAPIAAPAPSAAPAPLAEARPRLARALPAAPRAPARAVPPARPDEAPEAPQAPEAPEAPEAVEAPEPHASLPVHAHRDMPKLMALHGPPVPLHAGFETLERLGPQLAVAVRAAGHNGRSRHFVQVEGVEVDVRLIERQVERVVRHGERDRLRNLRSMARGVRQMERGADGMSATAARCRDPAYREQRIAAARARGERLTHEQLLRRARDLELGAHGLREGARSMRRAAAASDDLS
jgi:beta-lactamase regulating signal transducer with metallopeptidase domain